MNMEEYNYWGDPRVLAGMVDGGKMVGERLVVRVYEGDEERELQLRCRFEVCSLCRGHGTHVNPSIDASGLAREDFDDPDFAEGYTQGRYDVTCAECGGLRVVPVVDRKGNTAEDLAAYDDHMKAQWDDARATAAERRMGC
jgi:hypothetical protein